MRLFRVTRKDLHRFQVYTWVDARDAHLPICPSGVLQVEFTSLSSLSCFVPAPAVMRTTGPTATTHFAGLFSTFCEVYQHDQIENTGFRLLPKVRDHGFKRNVRFSRNFRFGHSVSLFFLKGQMIKVFFKGSVFSFSSGAAAGPRAL